MTQVSGARLPACFAAFPAAVLQVTADGMVVDSNGRLERELGRSIVGEPFAAVLDATSCGEKWRRAITAAREPNASVVSELVLMKDDDVLEPRPFSVMWDAESALIWLIEHPVDSRVDGIRREVTEVNSELSTAHRALVRERGRLDEFAHVISHDLKAPLRSVANYARWIEEDVGDALSAEARGHMALLRSQVDRMRRMISGVLEYARSGRTRAPVETVDTAALVGDVIALLAPPPTCTIEVAPGMPTLRTERAPLQQVFLNLIGNAIKHSRRDDAHVRVGFRDLGDMCDFSIQDNGPGIPPRSQEKIWMLFHTLAPRSPGGEGESEGTGVGLAIVRQLAELHGGRAWVESEEGKGATFHFLWPKAGFAVPE
jgi:signal transduction histidine kinase